MHCDRRKSKFWLTTIYSTAIMLAIQTTVLAQSSDTPTVTVPPAVVSTQEQIFGIIAICAAVLGIAYLVRLRQCKNNSGPGRFE